MNLDIETDFLSREKVLNICGRNISPTTITTSGILTSDQILKTLISIEDTREPSERGTKEDTLHNIVLPNVMLQLFMMRHKLSESEALERIQIQNEKKALFKEEFNESF